jgi:hypothetical protein
MRGPLPLSDSDFAAVRAKVLAEIERPRRSYGWYFALAASVAVAVLSMVAARRPVTVGPPIARGFAAPGPAALLPARGEKVAEGRMRDRHHPKPAKTHPIQVARIELHTADPDIRIIWITNQEAP